MGAHLMAYEEVADFIAQIDPSKLLSLKPSYAVQQRLEYLMGKKKDAGVTQEEQYELDRYLALEHLIALAKVRARALVIAA